MTPAITEHAASGHLWLAAWRRPLDRCTPEPAGARSLSRLGGRYRRPVAFTPWGPCRPSAGTA